VSRKKTKSKKFYYRRARWNEQGNHTLENLLKDAHNKLPTVGHRTFGSSNNELKGADFKANDKGLFLHIASYVPGQPTSTIDKDGAVNSATITAELAPEGKDFMDGDIFALVKDNHVILCPSGVREGVAASYFLYILEASKQKLVASSLELDKVSNTSKLKMIRTEGVKELQFSSSLYQASLHDLVNHQSTSSKLLAPISAQIKSVFAKDTMLNDITELENLNIKLSLKFDGTEGRRKHGNPNFGDAGRERLVKTAEMVLNEADDGGFVIVTGAGNKITAGEVRIADDLPIKVHGKSLNCSDAWEKLAQYFDQLKINGVLSQ
jgi:hypothetical protein